MLHARLLAAALAVTVAVAVATAVSAFDLKYYAGTTCSGDTITSLVWNTAGCTNMTGLGGLQTNYQTMIGCLDGKTTGEDYAQCALGGVGAQVLTYKVEQLNSVPGVRLFVFNESSLCAANRNPLLTFDVLEQTCSAVNIGSQACFLSPASSVGSSAVDLIF